MGANMNELMIINGNISTIEDKNLSNLIDQFIYFLDVKPNSRATYKRNLKQFFIYLQDQGIEEPTRQDIINYRDDLKKRLKATTVQNYLNTVKAFFEFLEYKGLYKNVAKKVKQPKVSSNHKKDPLSVYDIREIIKGFDEDNIKSKRDKAIFLTTLTGGLRTIEIVRADIGDIRQIGNITVLYVQGKGRDDKEEFIKLEDHTLKAIREYLKTRGNVKNDDPLFTSLSPNSAGERLTTRSVSRVIKDLYRSIGLDSERITAHSLRHTAVTLDLLSGNDFRATKQFARHKNLATTEIYSHNLDRLQGQSENNIARAIFEF